VGRYPRQVLIVSIGDLLLDIAIVPEGALVADDDSPAVITLGGGGQAANFCAWTAALGEPARLVTRVGDDDRGHRLVADLESQGVEVRAVWAKEPTGAIAVIVGSDGRRTMATQRGASIGLSPDDLDESWFGDASLLHVPAYSLFIEPLAAAARAAIRLVRESGGMLAVDLSSAAGLRAYGPARMAYVLARLKPEVLFATEAEADTLAVPLESLAQVPVLKLGPGGCRVFGRTIAAPAVAAVDPTGAGDAFAAAFCAAWLRGATPIDAAERGVQAASRSVLLAGARPT
jgi:ribokinase